MERIDIVLFDGFDEMDAVGPLEVLRNAAFDVRLVTLDGAREVRGSHDLVVRAEGAPRDDAELIVVPGGGWNDRNPAGARAEAEKAAVPAMLRERAEAGLRIASVCTGGMLLATAGLTDGRPATTHHGALGDLHASGASVIDARVVDDGDVITAGGVTSGLDLALHIVEREWGERLADGIAREMEINRDRRVWRSQAGQAG